MGLFSDIKALKDLQRIKNGGYAEMSISSITNLIINLADASKSLSKEEYNEVYSLYKKMRKCTAKFKIDIEGYYKTAVDILREFDKVVPCESYLGLEPFEASMLMGEIRKFDI